MQTGGSPEWLGSEMERRGWRPVDLAREAGLSTGTLSNVLRGSRRPGLHFCRKVAEALVLPPEQVLRHAGLLPPTPESTPSLREVDHLLSQLTPEQQDDVLVFVRALLEKWKRGRQARTTPTPE
jgi:transcriptional regulator with XRE-family HTH domain